MNKLEMSYTTGIIHPEVIDNCSILDKAKDRANATADMLAAQLKTRVRAKFKGFDGAGRDRFVLAEYDPENLGKTGPTSCLEKTPEEFKGRKIEPRATLRPERPVLLRIR